MVTVTAGDEEIELITVFGGFAPQSTSAETLSKALGSKTVMSGSVSRGKNDPTQSLQMIERPLMTPDELKSMPKGQFVVMKTGFYPMKVKLKLFFEWGIEFDDDNPYMIEDQGNRKVKYADKKTITDGIVKKYRPELLEPTPHMSDCDNMGSRSMPLTEKNAPVTHTGNKRKNKGGTTLQPHPKHKITGTELKNNGQA